MKKIFTHEAFIVGSIIVITVLASLSQTIIYWLQTPPATAFSFAHNYLEDYYYYLHSMRQGWDGAWLATSRLTPDIYTPQFVNVWLLFLGHLAKVMRISLPVMYTLARVIGAFFILFFSYCLICRVYKDVTQRLTSLCIVAFGTFFLSFGVHGVEVPWLVRAWTELDPLFRFSYIPHHLWSKVFFILLLLLLVQVWKKYFFLQIIVVATVTLLMGFSSPIIIAVYVPLIVLWFVIECAYRRNVHIGRSPTAFLYLVSIILSIFVAYHHRLVQHSVFPWTGSYIAWENFMRYPITLIHFIETLGPQFLLFIIAVPWLFRASLVTRLLLAWVAIGFFLLFVAGNFMPLSNSRYLAGYYFIPIGIGATHGLWLLSATVKRITNVAQKISISVLFISLFIYFIVGLTATWHIHERYIAENSTNPHVYIPKNIFDTLTYLATQPNTVVLARYDISMMIPAFTSHRVIAGNSLMSVDNEVRKNEMNSFFTYMVSPTAANDFLRKYNVGLIVEDNVNITADMYYKKMRLIRRFASGSLVVYARASE